MPQDGRDFGATSALIVTEDHVRLILAREQPWILLPELVIIPADTPVFLASPQRIFAIITVIAMPPFPVEELERTTELHRMSLAEIQQVKNSGRPFLHSYRIDQILHVMDPPRPFKREVGSEHFQGHIEFTDPENFSHAKGHLPRAVQEVLDHGQDSLEKVDFDKDPSTLTDNQLLFDHAMTHALFGRKNRGETVTIGGKSRSIEDIVNLHRLMVEEMGRREFTHGEAMDEAGRRLHELSGQKPAVKQADDGRMPVAPSGDTRGEKIFLQDILEGFKTFDLRSPFVWVVGGIVEHGSTQGDVDILIDSNEGELTPEMMHVIQWRIQRGLRAKMGDAIVERIHFLDDRLKGPFTDNVPVYALRLERINEKDQIQRMSFEPSVKQIKDASESSRQEGQDFVEEISKQEDPYLAIPDEDKGPYDFVMQNHWRGKSVHFDWRMENVEKRFLIGWTMAHSVAGCVKDPVITLGEARRVAAGQEDCFKIDLKTGVFKERRTRAGTVVRTELRAFTKSRQPTVWLGVEGKTREAEEGEAPPPGATKEFPGVFHIIDKGQAEYGRQSTFFHEYFLRGGKFQGRLVVRQLGRRQLEEAKMAAFEELDEQLDDMMAMGGVNKILPPSEAEEGGERTPGLWVVIQPIQQRPNVITKRSVDRGFLPPLGVSALPKAVRDRIPKDFRYWKAPNNEMAKEIRDNLVEQIDAGELGEWDWEALLGVPAAERMEKQEAKAEFKLTHQTWKGPAPIRFGPSTEEWTVWVDIGRGQPMRIRLQRSPLANDAIAAFIEKGPRRWMDIVGDIEPTEGRGLNQTKNTPSMIELLDGGTIRVLDNRDDFKRFRFEGKKFKGDWVAQREAGASQLWTFRKSELPETVKFFSNRPFQHLKEMLEMSPAH